MEAEGPTTLICTVLAMDHSTFCYRVCSACEKTLPDNSVSTCKYCNSSGSKRLFRILISIASDTRVFTVICFDRAVRVLFGCSADDFFNLAKLHPFAAVDAGKILEGEMCRMTLSKPKNGNAQHLRVAAITPLRSGFQPAFITLKELYGALIMLILLFKQKRTDDFGLYQYCSDVSSILYPATQSRWMDHRSMITQGAVENKQCQIVTDKNVRTTPSRQHFYKPNS